MRQFEVLKPECYSNFTCKCGDCRYTCCNGWCISWNAKERCNLEKKLKAPSSHFQLLNKKQQIGDKIYELVLKENGDCPFLSEQGMCEIQLKFGIENMSEICLVYPRVYHKYLNKLEFGLSPGCEKVLELLYEEKDGLQFVNQVETIPDYQNFSSIFDRKLTLKFPVLAYYYDIQSLCLGLLQAKDAMIEDKMILLGMALFRIDNMVKEGSSQQIPSYINKFINDMEAVDALNHLHEMKGTHLGSLYSNLTLIQCIVNVEDGPYNRLVKKIKDKLHFENIASDKDNNSPDDDTFRYSISIYQDCQKRFQAFIKGKEHFLENIAVAFLLYLNIPFYNPGNGVWKNYTYLIWTFTMIKFVLTVVIDEDWDTQDMIDCCTVMFRKLGHNLSLYNSIVAQLEANQNDTVAHMAVFLKSC